MTSPNHPARDPAFWRAGAFSATIVMSVVLAFLTVHSPAAIRPGGSNVPPYTVINQQIGYSFDTDRGVYAPVIGGEQPRQRAADVLGRFLGRHTRGRDRPCGRRCIGRRPLRRLPDTAPGT